MNIKKETPIVKRNLMTQVERAEYDEEADISVLSNDGDEDGFASNRVEDDGKSHGCIRNNPRIVFWATVLVLSMGVILPLEILDVVYKNDSVWIRMYGSGDVGGADWCEAIDADLTQFIIEPWNSRSDYAFMVWGCFLVVLGLSDFRRLQSSTDERQALSPVVSSFLDDKERGGGEASASAPPFTQEQMFPNPLLRYPHITFANGIFNLLHGLGSFWNHACECSYGGTADVAGMLAVTVFPLLYIPVQFLTLRSSSSGKQQCFNLSLSMIPPIGQTLVFVFVWFDIIPAIQTFTIVMGCTVGVIPLSIVYLYRWRNKRNDTTRQFQQQHHLRLWLFPMGLACFFLGFGAWQLDVKGFWCFQKGILKVLQGHVVWHLLTAVALVCVYWIYRSEQLTLVTTVDGDSLVDVPVI